LYQSCGFHIFVKNIIGLVLFISKDLFESPRAHSPLLAAESASIKKLP